MRTLEEIEACQKTMLVASDVAEYLRTDAQNIRLAARQAPGLLGFPVIVVGSRALIPKDGFVRFCRGLEAQDGA